MTEFLSELDFLGYGKFLGANEKMESSRGIINSRMIGVLIVALGIVCASTSEGQAVREAFKRVSSSVVVINTIQDVIGSPQNQRVSVAELGSGVLISKDGEILTAAHLVQTADTVLVQFSSGDLIVAKVIASEPAADVALLKLNRPPPPGALAARRTGSVTR